GTLRQTLWHLVEAEVGYARILTGSRPIPLPDESASLAELAAGIETMGPLWERLVDEPDVPNRRVTASDGWSFPGWVALAQAIQHADEHRTQVQTILGSRGLEVPEL